MKKITYFAKKRNNHCSIIYQARKTILKVNACFIYFVSIFLMMLACLSSSAQMCSEIKSTQTLFLKFNVLIFKYVYQDFLKKITHKSVTCNVIDIIYKKNIHNFIWQYRWYVYKYLSNTKYVHWIRSMLKIIFKI